MGAGTATITYAGGAVEHLEVRGGAASDTFNVRPYATAVGTTIFVDGGSPSAGDAGVPPAGDTLNLDLTGVTAAQLAFTGPGAGSFTSTKLHQRYGGAVRVALPGNWKWERQA